MLANSHPGNWSNFHIILSLHLIIYSLNQLTVVYVNQFKFNTAKAAETLIEIISSSKRQNGVIG